MVYRVGKSYRFEAAHSLPHHKGKCARTHGHSYRVEIVVSRDELLEADESSAGMVIDFVDLDALVVLIVEGLDHSDLNVVLAPTRTTAESLARYFYGRIAPKLATHDRMLTLSSVRVWETEKCWAEVVA